MDPKSALGGSKPISRTRGLHAEAARDVTGRQCPHSGEGEDFFDASAQKVENRSQVGK